MKQAKCLVAQGQTSTRVKLQKCSSQNNRVDFRHKANPRDAIRNAHERPLKVENQAPETEVIAIGGDKVATAAIAGLERVPEAHHTGIPFAATISQTPISTLPPR